MVNTNPIRLVGNGIGWYIGNVLSGLHLNSIRCRSMVGNRMPIAHYGIGGIAHRYWSCECLLNGFNYLPHMCDNLMEIDLVELEMGTFPDETERQFGQPAHII